jgi:hypothetical protein
MEEEEFKLILSGVGEDEWSSLCFSCFTCGAEAGMDNAAKRKIYTSTKNEMLLAVSHGVLQARSTMFIRSLLMLSQKHFMRVCIDLLATKS